MNVGPPVHINDSRHGARPAIGKAARIDKDFGGVDHRASSGLDPGADDKAMSHENDDPTTNFLRQLSYFESQEAIYKEELADALLAFNRIKIFVSDMIFCTLSQAKRDDLQGKAINKQFMARVEALELLLVSVPTAPRVPHARLKKLADERNAFAHGHFSADANTG